MALSVTAPEVTRVSYDGSEVVADWLPVDDPEVVGYQAEVYEVSGNGRDETVETGDTTATFSLAINPVGRYEFRVGAVLAGGGKGPTSEPLTVIDRAPVLDSISYAPPELTMNWTADQDEPGVTGYQAEVYAVDGGFAREETFDSASGGTMEVELDASVSYEVRVRGSGDEGIVTGPWSNELTPVVAGPELETVEYSGSELVTSWSAIEQATGYVLELYQVDGSYELYESTAATTATLTVALQAGGSYAVRVLAEAEDGRSKGPWGDELAVITEAPVLETVAYDGSALAASWSAVDEAGVDAYELRLLDGGSVAASASFAASPGGLEVTLDADGSYAVEVAATGGDSTVVGPWSNALVPIAEAPAGVTLSSSGAAFSARWQAVDETAVTGYRAALYADDTLLASVETGDTVATFDDALAPGVVYSARVRAVGEDVEGPDSEPAFGPYLAEVTYVYDSFGRLLSLSQDTGSFIAYSYDAAGNVLATTQSTPLPGSRQGGDRDDDD